MSDIATRAPQNTSPRIPHQVPGTSKPPKKKRRWIKRTVLGIILFVVGFPIVFTVYIFVVPHQVPMNSVISMGTRVGYSNREAPAPEPEQLFDTLEEAVAAEKDSFRLGKYVSDPIAEMPYEGGIAILFFIELDDGDTEFFVSRFSTLNGGYAPPPAVAAYAYTEPSMDGRYARFIYDSETERVAQYVEERFSDNLSVKKEVFAYYGVSTDPRIKDMTMLGKNPDGVIEYTYKDITYYFWYYNDDFVGYLENHPDFTFGGFTLNQVVDLLEIKTYD